MKVLFVCHGNICRSPMAEFVMKSLLKDRGVDTWVVESAAVSTEEIGNGIYPPARRCLSGHGISFDPGKTARQVTPADYHEFDRIFCMDESNMRRIRRIIPQDPQGKIQLLMTLTGVDRDVADPWYTGDFEQTFRDVMEACTAMINGTLK